MDLEEYRRIYMQAEGLGNTLASGARRTLEFGKSVARVPGAVVKDEREAKRKRYERREAIKDIKENGISFGAVKDILKSGPGMSTNTTRALSDVGRKALSEGLIVNELGSTAAKIVGDKSSNSYNSQDMEHGLRFLMKTAPIMRLPKDKMRAMKDIGKFGACVVETIADRASKKMPFDKLKEHEPMMTRPDMEIGR